MGGLLPQAFEALEADQAGSKTSALTSISGQHHAKEQPTKAEEAPSCSGLTTSQTSSHSSGSTNSCSAITGPPVRNTSLLKAAVSFTGEGLPEVLGAQDRAKPSPGSKAATWQTKQTR
eukprot:scaffold60731_cov17-Tisochrysis_lutea.AAC.3